MANNSHKTHVIYEFGRFVLDPAERTLYVDGEEVYAKDKADVWSDPDDVIPAPAKKK